MVVRAKEKKNELSLHHVKVQPKTRRLPYSPSTTTSAMASALPALFSAEQT